MGNLVHSRINFSRRDDQRGPQAYRDLIEAISPNETSSLIQRLEQARAGESVLADIDFRIASAEPVLVQALKVERELMLALAIVAPSRDYVSLWHQAQAKNGNAPSGGSAVSRASILGEEGLLGFSRVDLLKFGDARYPESMEWARRAVLAFEANGSFASVDLQSTLTAGSACHGAFRLDADSLSIRFSSMAPTTVGWLEALTEVLPEYAFHGACFDESAPYSLFFVSDGPGEMSCAESCKIDDLQQARKQVLGPAVRQLQLNMKQTDRDADGQYEI